MLYILRILCCWSFLLSCQTLLPSTFVFALQRGKFPIMLAADREHHDLVEILFPQTKPISLFPDWSVDGIIRAMKYLSFEPQVC
jgi:hypothetical protein